METNYIESVVRQFAYYKQLGDQAMAQVADENLFWKNNADSNSIANIVKHLWGNMRSRWTDFRTTDGEKEWRNRDAEFEDDVQTRAVVLQQWNDGWLTLFEALNSIKPEELGTIIYIRNQGHTILEAINRQLAHYPYHVGQIVFIAKMFATQEWKSLSIPKGASQTFNATKFAQPKLRGHFTDDLLRKD